MTNSIFCDRDVAFYCPRCMGRRDSGDFDWNVALCRSVVTPKVSPLTISIYRARQ